jgi:hypothetical protein
MFFTSIAGISSTVGSIANVGKLITLVVGDGVVFVEIELLSNEPIV